MKRARAFKWGFVSALALALALLFTLDFGFLRATIEKQATLAMGRALEIEGGLSIQLGPTIVIEAHDVRLANAEWAGTDDLLNVQRLYARVSAASLWRGPPLVQQLELEGATLSLVEDQDGRVNWEIAGDNAAEEPGAHALPLLLQHARVSDVTFNLSSPRLDEPLQAHVTLFEQSLDSQQQSQVRLEGDINQRPVTLSGVIGPWENLLTGENIQVDIEAGGDNATFSLAGRIDNLTAPSQPEIEFSATADSLEELSRTFGIKGLGSGALSMELGTRASDGRLSIAADALAGELRLKLTGDLPSLRSFSGLSLDLEAAGPSFGRLARLAGLEDWPEQPFNATARIQRPDGGLVIEQLHLDLAGAVIDLNGSVPNFPLAAGAEIELNVQGNNLAAFAGATGLPALSPGDFSIQGLVATPEPGLTTFDLNLALPLGGGHVRGNLRDNNEYDLDLDLSGPDLAQFSGFEGLGDLPQGPWQVAGQASGGSFDLRLETPIASGRASGKFQTASDFNLVLGVAGKDARATAEYFGLPGLPSRPWQLDLDAAQSDPAVVTLNKLSFSTDGLTLNAYGLVGDGPLQSGTDLRFTLVGTRLQDFQEFVPPTLTLPATGFGAEGHIILRDKALQLAPVELQVGDSRYSLDGTISLDESRVGTRVSLETNGKDIGRLFDLPGAARLPDGPFSSRGTVSVVSNQLEIDTFRLSAGSLELALDAAIPWPPAFARGQVSIVGSGDDIAQVFPELLDIQFDSTSFDLDLAARWDEEEIEFSKGQLRVGSSTLGISGSVDLPPGLSATNLTVSASAPDLSRLGTIDGKRWGKVPFELETRLAGNTKTFELSGLKIRLGEADILGIFKVDLTPATPELDLRLSTSVLNLRPFLGEEQSGSSPAPNQSADRRLIPDTALPLDVLNRVNGSFSIAADRLLLRRSTLVNALVNGQLRGGRLVVNELGTDTYGGRLAVTMGVEPKADGSASVSASIHSKGLILDFSDTPDDAKSALPPIDVDVDLEGTGATVRELAASLNGKLLVSSPGGIITNTNAINQRSPFLVQVISTISPLAFQQPQLEIACMAAVGTVKQGKVLIDPGLAIQSKRLNLLTSGSIDLGTEILDVHFNAHTRRAVDFTAGEVFSPYVKLSGTLAEPKIGVDPKSTLIKGGAAVLSGGLTILAKKALQQLEGTDDACARILEQAEANASKP